MLTIKKIIAFLVVFVILGLTGVALDLATGGVYGIRVTLVEGGKMADKRTRNWLNHLKKGWVFSPVLVLGFMVSPFLFIFALAVFIFDQYRAHQVFYAEDGTRVVYPGRPIQDTDGDNHGPGAVRGYLRSWFGPSLTGIVYCGEPLPENFLALHSASKEDVDRAKAIGWMVITIQGVEFLAPAKVEDQNQPLYDE